jgi:hypothetical protein
VVFVCGCMFVCAYLGLPEVVDAKGAEEEEEDDQKVHLLHRHTERT